MISITSYIQNANNFFSYKTWIIHNDTWLKVFVYLVDGLSFTIVTTKYYISSIEYLLCELSFFMCPSVVVHISDAHTAAAAWPAASALCSSSFKVNWWTKKYVKSFLRPVCRVQPQQCECACKQVAVFLLLWHNRETAEAQVK